MHATAPSSGSGLNALQRAPHGAEIGPADREIEEDDRHRDPDRGSDHERAAARGCRARRAALESRSCARPSPGRRSRSKDRQSHAAEPPARVAAEPSPWSRQVLRRARDHSPMPVQRGDSERQGAVPHGTDSATDARGDVRRRGSAADRDARSRPAHPRDEPVPDPARLARRHRAALGLRPVDRRRRHVADADGRPRGRRPRPPAHRAHHDPRRGADVDRPAVARAGRLLRGARARRDARGDPARRSRSCCSRSRLATATARTSGASSRSTFLVGFLAVLAGPWGWTIPRADNRAAALRRRRSGCSSTRSRRGVRRRTLLVLPLLVVWANLHGSVVLGAALTVLLGVVELVRARRLAWLPAALVVARAALRARLAVRDEARRLLRPDARRRAVRGHPPRVAVVEPERDDRALLAPRDRRGRAARACAAAAAASRSYELARARRDVRRRGAGGARRDLVRARRRGDPPGRARRRAHAGGRRRTARQPRDLARRARGPRGRAGRVRSRARRRGSSPEWPERAGRGGARRRPAIRTSRLWATDGTADWLLWRIPDLRGRIAYDVRFELYDERALDRSSRYGRRGARLAARRRRVRRRGRRRPAASSCSARRATSPGGLRRPDDLRPSRAG